jgi:hypothetical protein
MSLSILVRIIPELLREGRIAGQAEVVETGESIVFRDAGEVIGFIASLGAGQSPGFDTNAPAVELDTGEAGPPA